LEIVRRKLREKGLEGEVTLPKRVRRGFCKNKEENI